MWTDWAYGMTWLAGVRYVWGPGDRSQESQLSGEVQPCILTARLLVMVSLPVHMRCFNHYIVYTNMSGVTVRVCRYKLWSRGKSPRHMFSPWPPILALHHLYAELGLKFVKAL